MSNAHPWSKGFPKVVNRKMKKPRGDVEAMYAHRIEPKEPVVNAGEKESVK